MLVCRVLWVVARVFIVSRVLIRCLCWFLGKWLMGIVRVFMAVAMALLGCTEQLQ